MLRYHFKSLLFGAPNEEDPIIIDFNDFTSELNALGEQGWDVIGINNDPIRRLTHVVLRKKLEKGTVANPY